VRSAWAACITRTIAVSGGGAREQPATVRDPVADRGRDVAGVERRRPLRREQFERVGERRVPVHLADALRAALRHEVRPRLRRRVGDRREDLEQVCLLLVDLDATARGGDRGRDEIRGRQRGEALDRGPGARDRAVRAGGAGADVEHLHGVGEADLDGDERRVRRARLEPAAGRLDEEVEQHGVLARRRHEHVAAGPEPGEHRLRDERREHGGQRRVDRVAAGAEDLRAGSGGDGMARGDDAAHRWVQAQNLGMNSGTSTSIRLSRRGAPMRLTRGSPAGSRRPCPRCSERGARFSP
jgi:hypothetical protein